MKKEIQETLERDWIDALDGESKEGAIAFISSLPDNVVLSINWHGYDGADGEVVLHREETDEEYAARLSYEREEAEKKLREIAEKVEKDRQKREKEIAELKAKLKALGAE